MSDSLPVSVERLLAHRAWVTRISRALVDTQAEAVDLEQEVWCAALANPPREDRGLKSWFRVVIRRAARARWRSEGRRRAREERVARVEATTPTADLVSQAETEGRLVTAALALAEPYRETVLLRYFHDLAPREIAARQGIPVETVRTRLKRALARLRANLGEPPGRDRRALFLALGAGLMASKIKAGVAAAALVLAAATIWFVADRPPAPPPAPGPAAAVPPALPDDAPTTATETDRVEVLVRDLRGRPVAGASVTLHPVPDWQTLPRQTEADRILDPRAPEAAAYRDRTADDGRTAFAGVATGTWWVVAEAEGYATGRARVHVHPDGRRASAEILLAPAVRLTGAVRTVDGEPLAGARVEAEIEGNRRSAPVGEAGRYALGGLSPGRMLLFVRLPTGVVVGRGAVDVPRSRELDIVLDLSVTVRGRVVDDGTGRPVDGARVSVLLDDAPRSHARSAGRTTSGRDGTWSIGGLPPVGLSRIQATAEGYRPYDRTTGSRAERLAPGAVFDAEIRLGRGGTLRGRIRTEDGEPVAGARVSVRMQAGGSRDTESDDAGRYEIRDLAAGLGRIRVTATEHYQIGIGNVGHDYETLPENDRVEMPAGAVVEKDVLMARGGVIEGVARAADGGPCPRVGVNAWPDNGRSAAVDELGEFHLAGVRPGDEVRVVAHGAGGESGESAPFALSAAVPVTGVEVVVSSGGVIAGRVRRADGTEPDVVELRHATNVRRVAAGDWEGGWMSAPLVPVVPDGSFRLEGLRPGTHTFLARCAGGGETVGPWIELAAGETRGDVEIVLGPALVIAGTVVVEGRGPAAGVPIHAIALPPDDEWGPRGWGAARTTTDEAGRFSIEGLGDYTYRVTADLPGLLDRFADVSAGTTDLAILARAALAIAGRILDGDTGRPVAGIAVTAAQVATIGCAATPASARTDAGGRFRLAPLREGGYRIRVGGAGYVEQTITAEAGASGLEVHLQPGAAIAGRVVDHTGAPIPGIRMTPYRRIDAAEISQAFGLAGRGGSGRASTALDGAFRLDRLEPGVYDLRFWDTSDRGFPETEVTGVRAGTTDLRVVMSAGLAISGKIVGPDGGPPPDGGRLAVYAVGETKGAGVIMTRDESGRMVRIAGEPAGRSVRVAGDGTFRTDPLDAGKVYVLSARDWPGLRKTVVSGIAPGTDGVVVRLSRGGVIRGKVVDGNGDPVRAGIRVEAFSLGGGRDRPSTEIRADGTFVLAGLGDGEYTLMPGGRSKDYQVVESARARAGATDVVLTVKTTVVLSGRLVDADGRPVSAVIRSEQRTVDSGTGTFPTMPTIG